MRQVTCCGIDLVDSAGSLATLVCSACILSLSGKLGMVHAPLSGHIFLKDNVILSQFFYKGFLFKNPFFFYMT